MLVMPLSLMSQGLVDPLDLRELNKGKNEKNTQFILPQDSTSFLENFELLKESKKEGYLLYRAMNHDSSIIELISVKVRFDTIEVNSDLFRTDHTMFIEVGDTIGLLSSAARSDEIFSTLLFGSDSRYFFFLYSLPKAVWLTIGITVFFALVGLFKIIF